MNNKDMIRKEIIAKRDSLSEQEILEKSKAIADRLFSLLDYKDADNILIYASMRSEVITDGIIADALKGGKNVFCPKCIDKDNGVMLFYKIDSLDDLKEGYYGIREPEYTSDSEVFDDTKDIDKTLVIVPGVAFDRGGNRIGYKGGYYDRFLSKYPNIKTIALAYDLQIAFHIPADAHDIPVLKVITESDCFLSRKIVM